ncbi:restriction endonuclease subunit S [Ureaplasma ceti]|uniref:Type I restriction modification DNA specificity domain-containing protein n=1 Tax=Ureaplasma ceti TaxID=3119530 RepID=A0ABP9U701_9BACT
MNKQVPQIRFKGFDENWEFNKLNQICKYKTSSLTSKDIDKNGKYDLYDANEIIGKTNKKFEKCEYITIIKDGSGVGKVRKLPEYTTFIGTMGAIYSDITQLDFLYELLKKMDFSKYKTEANIPHIYFSNYGEEIIAYTNINEQRKIGNFFVLLNNLLALYKKKCEKLEKIKSTLIKTLLDSSDSIFVKNEKYSFDRRLINEVISVIPFKKFICNKLDLNGSFPVIQQGDNPLIGYSNQMPYMKYEDVIVFGDHTLSLYKPTSPFLVATDGVKIIKNNDSYICKEFLIYLLINNLPKSEGYKRHFQLLNGKEVNVITSKNIQKILSNLFFSMDKSIALCKREYCSTLNHKIHKLRIKKLKNLIVLSFYFVFFL